MRSLLIAPLLVGISASALAVDCAALAPTAPVNGDVSFKGKVDAKVDGLFKKLFTGAANVEGDYRNIATNVLKEFPNADTLYMWERVLYLDCQVIRDASDMSSVEKLNYIQGLLQKANSPPASVNSATNSGSGSVIIQGNGNTVSGK